MAYPEYTQNLDQEYLVKGWSFDYALFDHDVSQILVIPKPKVGHIGHID